MDSYIWVLIGFLINLTSLGIALYALHNSHETNQHIEKHLKRSESYSETLLAAVEQERVDVRG